MLRVQHCLRGVRMLSSLSSQLIARSWLDQQHQLSLNLDLLCNNISSFKRRLAVSVADSINDNSCQNDSIDDSTSSANHIFDVCAAVAFAPKRLRSAAQSSFTHQQSESSLSIDSSPDTHPDCGEDAFFTFSSDDYMVWGIADGVGGWSNVGVDPSLFAWELMDCCHTVAIEMQFPEPKSILAEGYDRLLKRKLVKAGSSTATIITFEKKTCKLSTANLGDSGYLLIRDNKLFFKSTELQHYFNAPYQLSVFPKHMKGNLSDTPDSAVVNEHQLQHGDFIILATDGLFDNLYTSDILSTIESYLSKVSQRSLPKISTSLPSILFPSTNNTQLSTNNTMQYQIPLSSFHTTPPQFPSNSLSTSQIEYERILKLTKLLCSQARNFAMNQRRQSPFAESASKATGRVVMGGKLDDVTLLAGLVIRSSPMDSATLIMASS